MKEQGGAKSELMEVNKELFPREGLFELKHLWSAEEIEKLPARTLAYIGDAVFELGLRLRHVRMGMDDAGRLHSTLTEFVSAIAQSRLFARVLPELSETEQCLVKRWRNAKTPSRYGSGTRGEYARATALEAWVAYLFLTGQNSRLEELFVLAMKVEHGSK